MADERQRRRAPGRAASSARGSRPGPTPCADPLQDVLLVEHAQLVRRRQRVGQRGHVRGRGRGSGPRPSWPSASGRPATTAGSRRAAFAISRYWSCARGDQRPKPAGSRPSRSRDDVATRQRRAAASGENSRCSAAVPRHRMSWPKPGDRHAGQVLPEELPRHRALRNRRAREVRVEALEQQRAPARSRAAAPRTGAPSPRGTGRSPRTSRRRPRRSAPP